MPTLTQSSTHSSDYFDDDPEFLKALSELPLPEPEPEQDAGHRSLSVAEEPNSGPSQVPTSPDDEEPPRRRDSMQRDALTKLIELARVRRRAGRLRLHELLLGRPPVEHGLLVLLLLSKYVLRAHPRRRNR